MTDDRFESFWASYPHKVGKKAAEKKYWVVRREVEHDTIMHGLALYKETKPDWKAWCNPATWLNQGRWEDQPADTRPPDPGERSAPQLPPCYRPREDNRPRESAEQKRHKQLRLDAHDIMRKRGHEPASMPVDQYKTMLADIMAALAAGRTYQPRDALDTLLNSPRRAEGGGA